MSFGLTQRQTKLLTYIRTFFEERGTMPTFDQIKVGAGFKSKGNIHELMAALEERGYIRRLFNRARGIELLDPMPLIDAATEIELTGYCARAGATAATVVALALAEYYRNHPVRFVEPRR